MFTYAFQQTHSSIFQSQTAFVLLQLRPQVNILPASWWGIGSFAARGASIGNTGRVQWWGVEAGHPGMHGGDGGVRGAGSQGCDRVLGDS